MARIVDRVGRLGPLFWGSLVALLLLAATDWPLGLWSSFWSTHAMLTNLVSSGVFVLLVVAVVDRLVRRSEERKLSAVKAVAYNALARAPIGQRRAMWFLVHGGHAHDDDGEFGISETLARRVHDLMEKKGLDEVFDEDVIARRAPLGDLMPRLHALAQDEEWLIVSYAVLRRIRHDVRAALARWAPVLMAAESGSGALRELGAQAEELSAVLVTFFLQRRHGGAGPLDDAEIAELYRHWTKAFANAVALDEAFIRRGGERGRGWASPEARWLLPEPDRAALGASRSTMRLYPGNDRETRTP